MINKALSRIIPGVCILLLFNSCVPEEFNTTGVDIDPINPEYAVPLINSDLSMEDVISPNDSSTLRKDNTGFLSLVYQGSMYSALGESLVSIPDQNMSESVTLTGPQASALSSGQAVKLTFTSAETFSLPGKELDSLWIKAGTLLTGFTSQVKTGGTAKISFIGSHRNDTVLSVVIPFSYAGSPVSVSSQKNLAGYHLNMSLGPQGYSECYISYEINFNGTSNTVLTSDQIRFDLNLNALKFSRLYGYLGKLSLIDGGNTIDLSIFDKTKSGQFNLEDPKLKLIFYNSYGVPMAAAIPELSAYSDGEPPQSINGLPSPLPVPVPSIAQAGQTLVDSVTLDKNNSNFATVISAKPKHVMFKVQVDLNPGGKTQRNFITDKSQVRFRVNVELPMYGSAKDYVMEEEQEAKLDLKESDVIEQLLFRFIADNGFPVDMATQVYLLDSSKHVFDSLFSDRNYLLLKGAATGTDGKVTSPVSKTTDVVFDKLRADRLRDLRYFKLRAEMETASNGGTYPSVKLYSHYVLHLKIGVKAKVSFKLEE